MAMTHQTGGGVMRERSAAAQLSATAILAALVLLLPACSSGSQSPGNGTTVTMSGLAFTVAEITVPVGDVTFVNKDGVEHLIAEGDNGIEVATPRIQKVAIAANAQGVVTFGAAGDYHITCLIHHAMHLVVHVQ
jgi:plastocyanin